MGSAGLSSRPVPPLGRLRTHRGSHQQAARCREVRRPHHFRIGGVAGDGFPPRPERRDPAGIVLDHQQCRVRGQRRADEGADAAVTDQDHMIGEARERNRLAGGGFSVEVRDCVRRRFRLGLRQPSVERGKEHGIEQIERIAPARMRSRAASGNNVKRDAETRQDERKLADLRQARRKVSAVAVG